MCVGARPGFFRGACTLTHTDMGVGLGVCVCVCELICVHTQVFKCILMFVYLHVLLFAHLDSERPHGGLRFNWSKCATVTEGWLKRQTPHIHRLAYACTRACRAGCVIVVPSSHARTGCKRASDVRLRPRKGGWGGDPSMTKIFRGRCFIYKMCRGGGTWRTATSSGIYIQTPRSNFYPSSQKRLLFALVECLKYLV